jgi:hypothetical protein
MAQHVDADVSGEPQSVAEPQPSETLDDLADLEDIEFLLEEIEDQIAPLARRMR